MIMTHVHILILLLLLDPSSALTSTQNLPSPVDNTSMDSPDMEEAGSHTTATVALRVFSVDYHHVQAPFEIVLWIMLASLAKLGESFF